LLFTLININGLQLKSRVRLEFYARERLYTLAITDSTDGIERYATTHIITIIGVVVDGSLVKLYFKVNEQQCCARA